MKTSAALRRALLPFWARSSGLHTHSLNSRALAAQPRLRVAAARPLSFFGYKLRARPGPENLSVVPVSASSSSSPTAQGRLARKAQGPLRVSPRLPRRRRLPTFRHRFSRRRKTRPACSKSTRLIDHRKQAKVQDEDRVLAVRASGWRCRRQPESCRCRPLQS